MEADPSQTIRVAASVTLHEVPQRHHEAGSQIRAVPDRCAGGELPGAASIGPQLYPPHPPLLHDCPRLLQALKTIDLILQQAINNAIVLPAASGPEIPLLNRELRLPPLQQVTIEGVFMAEDVVAG